MLVRLFDTHFRELLVSQATIRRGADSRTTTTAACRFTADENQNK
ncbi:MAG: hypothetical protein V3R14_06940 [Nitrospinaceae bacterium]